MQPSPRVVNIEPAHRRTSDRMFRPKAGVPVLLELHWDNGDRETDVTGKLVGWFGVPGQMRSAFVEWSSGLSAAYAAVLPARYIRPDPAYAPPAPQAGDDEEPPAGEP